MDYRTLLREITPPVIRRTANRLIGGPVRYSGPLASWESAAALGTYEDPTILQQVLAATRDVLEHRAVFEQDGMTFATPPPPSPALDGILLAAACNRGNVSVLDFGGALGSHFLRWRPFLQTLPGVAWCVVEQRSYVAAGRDLYTGRGLPVSFESDLGSGASHRPDAILASGVLQYLPDSMGMLIALEAIRAPILILDRAPLSRDDGEYVMLQQVSPPLHAAKYPLRVLSRSNIQRALADTYALLCEFPGTDSPLETPQVSADYRGMIWRRRD